MRRRVVVLVSCVVASLSACGDQPQPTVPTTEGPAPLNGLPDESQDTEDPAAIQ